MKSTLQFGSYIASPLVLASFILLFSCMGETGSHDPAQDATRKNEEKFVSEKKELDAQFLVKAASINQQEIKLAQLAQQLSKKQEIKDMATMMETDHAKSLEELKMLAGKKLITLPGDVTHDGQDLYDALNMTPVSEFDNRYCALMVKGHQDAIEVFEKASLGAYDDEVKSWANKTLTILHNHLGHAEMCLKKTEMFIPDGMK